MYTVSWKGLSLKGQSSVEFLMVVGIALAVSAPFVLSAQRSIINIQSTQEAVTVQNSLDKLEEAVETVSVSGEPARRTFYMPMPDNVVDNGIVQDTAVYYTLRTRSGNTNVSRSFETKVKEVGEALPDGEGAVRVSVYAWNNQVNISAVGQKSEPDGSEQDDEEKVPTPLKKALFYVNNGKLGYLNVENGSTDIIYQAKAVKVLGPQNPDIDDDKKYEVPFVTSDGDLHAIDIDGEKQLLAANAKSQKSKLGLSLSGSKTGILYPGNSNNNYEIYNVSTNSDSKEVADPGDGVSAVSGRVDFDGDNKKEIVFVGGSQTLQYVDHNGNPKSTGVGVGSNNGLGLGHPHDFDKDGEVRVPIVDGSNNIVLINDKGDKTSVTTSSPARKTSIAVMDMDGDSDKEIAYISKDNSAIKYLDSVTNQNKLKNLETDVKPDTSVGITARID